jgi:hypothetical protein
MRWSDICSHDEIAERIISAISKAFGFRLKVARPVRVELTTYSFGGCRSIHLSYGRTVAFHRKTLESHAKMATRSIILTLARLARQSALGARAGRLFWLSRRFAFSRRKAFEFSLWPGP